MTRPLGNVRLLAAILALTATEAPAASISFVEAVATARASHPSVAAAEDAVRAARGARRQAGLPAANPVIAVDLADHAAPGVDHVDRGVSIGQEVEIGGQRGLRASAADAAVERAEWLLADARRVVDAEARRAFAGDVAAERSLAVARDALAITERLAEVARRRAGAGDAARLDVHLASVDEARATHAVALAETARAASAMRLATAIGAPPDAEVHAAGDAVPALVPAPEAELIAAALATRPDLNAAEAERRSLEAQAAAVRRQGRVPNPTLRAFYREELGHERIAGGEISFPLPFWNRGQGTEEGVLAQAAAAAVEVERLRRQIPREVRMALERRRAASSATLALGAEAATALDAATAELRRAVDAGYLALADALVQQERLLQARQASVDAWREAREADVDLLEAVGGAW